MGLLIAVGIFIVSAFYCSPHDHFTGTGVSVALLGVAYYADIHHIAYFIVIQVLGGVMQVGVVSHVIRVGVVSQFV